MWRSLPLLPRRAADERSLEETRADPTTDDTPAQSDLGDTDDFHRFFDPHSDNEPQVSSGYEVEKHTLRNHVGAKRRASSGILDKQVEVPFFIKPLFRVSTRVFFATE
jgi:hypothetical protein